MPLLAARAVPAPACLRARLAAGRGRGHQHQGVAHGQGKRAPFTSERVDDRWERAAGGKFLPTGASVEAAQKPSVRTQAGRTGAGDAGIVLPFFVRRGEREASPSAPVIAFLSEAQSGRIRPTSPRISVRQPPGLVNMAFRMAFNWLKTTGAGRTQANIHAPARTRRGAWTAAPVQPRAGVRLGYRRHWGRHRHRRGGRHGARRLALVLARLIAWANFVPR